MTSGDAFGALGWRGSDVSGFIRCRSIHLNLRDGAKSYLGPVHLEPFLESACCETQYKMMSDGMGVRYDGCRDVHRTAFLSVSRASLACKARGMASRHTFQNLALTHDAWKRTAGRDY
jgi:hypothetical protein